MLPILKNSAGLVFNEDGECIATYSHSGVKDQVKNRKLQFEKDIVFEIHNKIVHKIKNPNGKKIQIDCNLCGKYCQSKEKYKEHFNIQHNAKVFQATNRLLKQKEKTISDLQKKIVENGKYTKQLEESVEKTSLCTICVEERRNLIFFPCMHIVACTKCGKHQTITRCPICRMNITEKQKVIIS